MVERVTQLPFCQRVRVVAEFDCESSVYESFLGDRVFFLEEGEELVLLVRGRGLKCGDRLRLDYLVDEAVSWSAIPWDWD